ncbi:unnamed protein product [Rhodiola kirilowii]
MLIDFVPTVSGVSLAEAPAFKKAPGGAPANVAVAVSKLGGSSAFVGKVGSDEFGYMLAEILKDNNVDNSAMRFDKKARTALAFVTLRDDGEREFFETELDIKLIKQATVFHYGSISLIDEPCKSTHKTAMRVAKESGAILSFDPQFKISIINEDEIRFLTHDEDPYDDNVVLTKLFHPNLKILLVTEGAKGCRYYTKTFKGTVHGVKVKAVDTTGAGDSFVGGLLYKLASDINLHERLLIASYKLLKVVDTEDEQKLRDAITFANVCGAITVTGRGAIPSLPTKEAVLNMLKNVNS